jgi:hypothetical protein
LWTQRRNQSYDQRTYNKISYKNPGNNSPGFLSS